jgi:hypothetical protein
MSYFDSKIFENIEIEDVEYKNTGQTEDKVERSSGRRYTKESWGRVDTDTVELYIEG